MRFIAIDSETTGLDPSTCQMLELGMIHADIRLERPACDCGRIEGGRCHMECPSRQPGKVVADVDVKHWYIKPMFGSVYTGEPYAMKMNAGIIAKINSGQVEAVSAEALVPQIAPWLKSHGYTGSGFVPCGKNVMGFDMRFLRRLPGWGYPAIKHKHRAIDVGTLMLRPTDDCPPDLAECKRRAGLPERVSHLAVDDAMDCVDIVKWWFKRGGQTL